MIKSLFTYSLIITSVNCHGFMTKPHAVYFDDSSKTNYITRVDAKSLFKDYTWDYSPSENANEYKRLVDNGGIIQPLRAFMDERIDGCPMNDLSIVVGTFNFTTMEFLNDQAREGLIRTHEGPCEIWIDDMRVFSDMNCAAHYSTYPASLPIDYSKCTNNKCTLSFYWCALHESFWQLFKHCVTISNSLTSTEQINVNEHFTVPPTYVPTTATSTSTATPTTATPITATPTTASTSTSTSTPTTATPTTATPIKRCRIKPVNQTQAPTISNTGINIITNKFILEGGTVPESAGVSINGKNIDLHQQYSPRIYMLNENGNKYQMFNLNNKKISFDVDISNVPCDYNLALYFSEMKEDASIGHGYCDAQGQGYSCSEMDIFEGNEISMHLTSHPCEYSNCDRDGVVSKLYFKRISNNMHVETKFFMTNNVLSYIEQSITWNEQIALQTIKETNAFGGLKQMGESFKNGMVLVMSIWTAGDGGMAWMNGQCNGYRTDISNIHGIFYNIAISDI